VRGVGVHDVAGDGELSPGRVGRPLGEQRRRARGRRPAADRQLLRLTARRQHPAAQPLRSTSVPTQARRQGGALGAYAPPPK